MKTQLHGAGRTAVAILLLFSMTPLFADSTWRSSLYPTDWTPGFADKEGHFLHDFSYAGYHRGEKPVPQKAMPGEVFDVTQPAYGADKTGATDSTVAIQKALDAAAVKGGIVLLPAGTYKIAPQGEANVALKIGGDNIVFRGEGVDKTFIFTEQTNMRGKTLLQVIAPKPAEWLAEAGVPVSPMTSDLSNQSTVIPVADTAAFKVGDLVSLRSDLTQRFIDSVEMNGKWNPAGATSPNRTLVFCRRVTAVDPEKKTLTIDVPTRYPMLVADLARVVKIPGHMISETGLEDFSIGMKQHPDTVLGEEDYQKPGTAAYEVHGSMAIVLSSVENCWVQRVNTYGVAGNAPDVHLLSNGLKLSRSRFVTVTDCDWKFTQYKGGGGNGYLYTMHGQENLIVHCKAEGGRHNYSFGTMASSGNVIKDLYAKDGKLASDFHMFLSMSNLLDGITCDGDFLEARRYRPWGGNPIHGVTTTQTVFWNINGLRYSPEALKTKPIIVRSDQIGFGYVIGTRGPASGVDTTNFVEGVGKGETMEPASLYQDQLERRLKRAVTLTQP